MIDEQDLSPRPEAREPARKDPYWGPWATTGFGCLIGVVIFAVQAFVALVYTGIQVALTSPADINEMAFRLMRDGFLISIATLVSTVVGLVMIAVIIKIRNTISVADYLGLRRVSRKTLLYMLPLAAAFVLLAHLVSLLPGRTDDGYILDIYNTSVWIALLWLVIVIFGPLIEEVFFRGFVFVSLRKSVLGIGGTVIVTSFVWTMLHLGQYDYLDLSVLFLFGLILGVIRHRTDSLWPPLVLHSVYNLMVMVLVALTVMNVI